MKNYRKPTINESSDLKLEGIYAASGSLTPDAPKATCPKWVNKYNVDMFCGNCPHHVSVPGWSIFNDLCDLNK